MDCVRPDYLTGPILNRLKEDGLTFTQCIAQAPHTSTSHTSILTGMYPFHHGVRWLVDFQVGSPMIQEVLKKNNYATAAFIGGFPLSSGDMNRGFDIFEYSPACRDVSEGRGDFTPANVLITKAIQWLNEQGQRDCFLFLHFFDCHFTLRSEMGDTSYKRRERRYREEIEFIGKQMDILLSLVDVDLLILTADHGEKMAGEKIYPWVINSKGEQISAHFHEVELYDIQLLVPLIFYGKMIKPGIIHNQARSVDIFPTLLGIAGIEAPPVDGVNLLQGEYPEYAYSETYFAQLHAANSHCYTMNEKYEWGWKGIDSLISLRSSKGKLICTANEVIRPYQFFDLERDKKEDVNLVNEIAYKDTVRIYLSRLMQLIERDRQFEATGQQTGEDVAEKLKALGYL